MDSLREKPCSSADLSGSLWGCGILVRKEVHPESSVQVDEKLEDLLNQQAFDDLFNPWPQPPEQEIEPAMTYESYFHQFGRSISLERQIEVQVWNRIHGRANLPTSHGCWLANLHIALSTSWQFSSSGPKMHLYFYCLYCLWEKTVVSNLLCPMEDGTVLIVVTNHTAHFVSISQHDHTLARITFCCIPIGR